MNIYIIEANLVYKSKTDPKNRGEISGVKLKAKVYFKDEGKIHIAPEKETIALLNGKYGSGFHLYKFAFLSLSEEDQTTKEEMEIVPDPKLENLRLLSVSKTTGKQDPNSFAKVSAVLSIAANADFQESIFRDQFESKIDNVLAVKLIFMRVLYERFRDRFPNKPYPFGGYVDKLVSEREDPEPVNQTSELEARRREKQEREERDRTNEASKASKIVEYEKQNKKRNQEVFDLDKDEDEDEDIVAFNPTYEPKIEDVTANTTTTVSGSVAKVEEIEDINDLKNTESGVLTRLAYENLSTTVSLRPFPVAPISETAATRDQALKLANEKRSREGMITTLNTDEEYIMNRVTMVVAHEVAGTTEKVEAILSNNNAKIEKEMRGENLVIHGEETPDFIRVADEFLALDTKTHPLLNQRTSALFSNQMGLMMIQYAYNPIPGNQQDVELEKESKDNNMEMRIPNVLKENHARFAFLKLRSDRASVNFDRLKTALALARFRLPRRIFGVVLIDSVTLFSKYFIDVNEYVSKQLNKAGGRKSTTAAFINSYINDTGSDAESKRIEAALALAFGNSEFLFKVNETAIDKLKSSTSDRDFEEFEEVVFGFLVELQNNQAYINPYACRYDEGPDAVIATTHIKENTLIGICPGYAMPAEYLLNKPVTADLKTKPDLLRQNKLIRTCCDKGRPMLLFVCVNPFKQEAELLDEFKPSQSEGEFSPFVFLDIDEYNKEDNRDNDMRIPNARLVLTSDGLLGVITIRPVKSNESILIDYGIGEEPYRYSMYGIQRNATAQRNAETLAMYYDPATGGNVVTARKTYSLLTDPMVLYVEMTTTYDKDGIPDPLVSSVILYQQITNGANKDYKAHPMLFSAKVKAPTERSILRKNVNAFYEQKYKLQLPLGLKVSRTIGAPEENNELLLQLTLQNNARFGADAIIKKDAVQKVPYSMADMRLHTIMARISSYFDDLCVKTNDTDNKTNNTNAARVLLLKGDHIKINVADNTVTDVDESQHKAAKMAKLLEVISDLPDRYFPQRLKFNGDKFESNNYDVLCQQVKEAISKYRAEYYPENLSFGVNKKITSGSLAGQNLYDNQTVANYDARPWDVSERNEYLKFAQESYLHLNGRRIVRNDIFRENDVRHSIYFEDNEIVYCPADILGGKWNTSNTVAVFGIPQSRRDDNSDANVYFSTTAGPYLVLITSKPIDRQKPLIRLNKPQRLVFYGFKDGQPAVFDRSLYSPNNPEAAWISILSSDAQVASALISDTEINEQKNFEASLLIAKESVPADYLGNTDNNNMPLWDKLIYPQVTELLTQQTNYRFEQVSDSVFNNQRNVIFLRTLDMQIADRRRTAESDPDFITDQRRIKDELLPETRKTDANWTISHLLETGRMCYMAYPYELDAASRPVLKTHLIQAFRSQFIWFMGNRERQESYDINKDPIVYVSLYLCLYNFAETTMKDMGENVQTTDFELKIRAFLYTEFIKNKLLKIDDLTPFELYALNIDRKANSLPPVTSGKKFAGSLDDVTQAERNAFRRDLKERNVPNAENIPAVRRKSIDQDLFTAFNALIIREANNPRRQSTQFILGSTLYFVSLHLRKMALEQALLNLHEYKTTNPQDQKKKQENMERLKTQINEYRVILLPKGHKLTELMRMTEKHGTTRTLVSENEFSIKAVQAQQVTEALKEIEKGTALSRKLEARFNKVQNKLESGYRQIKSFALEYTSIAADDGDVAGEPVKDLDKIEKELKYANPSTAIIGTTDRRRGGIYNFEDVDVEEEEEEEEEELEDIVDVNNIPDNVEDLVSLIKLEADDANGNAAIANAIQEEVDNKISTYIQRSENVLLADVQKKLLKLRSVDVEQRKVVETAINNIKIKTQKVQSNKRRAVNESDNDVKDFIAKDADEGVTVAEAIDTIVNNNNNNNNLSTKNKPMVILPTKKNFDTSAPADKKPNRKIQVSAIATTNTTTTTTTTTTVQAKGQIGILDQIKHSAKLLNQEEERVRSMFNVPAKASVFQQDTKKVYIIDDDDDDDDDDDFIKSKKLTKKK